MANADQMCDKLDFQISNIYYRPENTKIKSFFVYDNRYYIENYVKEYVELCDVMQTSYALKV